MDFTFGASDGNGFETFGTDDRGSGNRGNDVSGSKNLIVC